MNATGLTGGSGQCIGALPSNLDLIVVVDR